MKNKLKNKLTNPFAIFVYKKVAFTLLIFAIAMNIVFILPRLMPGNPASMALSQAQVTTVAGSVEHGGQMMGGYEFLEMQYMEMFGLDKDLSSQYRNYWERFFTMDYGRSFMDWPRPVSEMVMHALPWTLLLVIPVLPIGFLIGNWIGSKAAFERGKLDNLIYYLSTFLSRAPYYWFALILMFVLGVQAGWFPLSGAYSARFIRPTFSLEFIRSAAHHWVLPFLSVLGLAIGRWAVGMRAMTLYEMESDYMKYGKQLGFSQSRLRNMAKGNAILPNFTSLPMVITGLISQTLIVEFVFDYPGLGTLLFNSAQQMDYPVLQATFVIIILIVVLGNMLVDIVYGVIDPRVGTGYIGGE